MCQYIQWKTQRMRISCYNFYAPWLTYEPRLYVEYLHLQAPKYKSFSVQFSGQYNVPGVLKDDAKQEANVLLPRWVDSADSVDSVVSYAAAIFRCEICSTNAKYTRAANFSHLYHKVLNTAIWESLIQSSDWLLLDFYFKKQPIRNWISDSQITNQTAVFTNLGYRCLKYAARLHILCRSLKLALYSCSIIVLILYME